MKRKFQFSIAKWNSKKKTWEKWKVKQKQYVESPSTTPEHLPRPSSGFRHWQLSSTLTQLRSKNFSSSSCESLIYLHAHASSTKPNSNIHSSKILARGKVVQILLDAKLIFWKPTWEKKRKFINIQSWKVLEWNNFALRNRTMMIPQVISICDADVKWKSMIKVFVLFRAAAEL